MTKLEKTESNGRIHEPDHGAHRGDQDQKL